MGLLQDGLTLVRMRALLRKGLGGLDDVDLPDVEADEFLNLSFWDVSDRFHFEEKECRVESEAVAGQREYAVPNDVDSLISVSLKRIFTEPADPADDAEWVKMVRASWHKNDETRLDSPDAEDFPRMYVRRDQTIVLMPTPDKAYPMQIMMFRTLASLEAGVVDTTGLPRNWHSIVVMGALRLGHFYNQDYNEARQAQNFQVSEERKAVLSNTENEKFDSRYAGLRVIDELPPEGGEFDEASVLRFFTRPRGV